MAAIKIPDWLLNRPIDSGDTAELVSLAKGKNIPYFRDIAIESIEQFYNQQPRTSFYKLIRILGFYGVIFSGRLAGYSGPQEDYPDVLCIRSPLWQERIALHMKDPDVARPFYSSGILTMKQLHGVPVKSFIVLTGKFLPHGQISSLLPVTITRAHDSLFNSCPSFPETAVESGESEPRNQAMPNQQQPDSPTDYSDPRLSSPVEDLQLSVRSKTCLRRANINTISELLKMSDRDLLAIRHFGSKSLREIRTKLELVLPGWAESRAVRLNVTPEEPGGIEIDSEESIRKLNTRVSDLPLTIRSRGCLRKKNIQYIWQLVQMTEVELLKIHNLGRKSYNELQDQVKKLGLRTGMHFTPEQINKIRTVEYSYETETLNKIIKTLVNELSCLPLKFLNTNENLVVAERILRVGRKKSLETIARNLSLTRERIRQIERTALNKIRQQFKRELRAVVPTLKKQVDQFGGLANLDELDLDLAGFSAQEQAGFNCMLALMDQALFIDWKYRLISSKGEGLLLLLCDEIRNSILNHVSDKFFTRHDLEAAVRKVLQHRGLFSGRDYRNFVNKFCKEIKVSSLKNRLCFGRITKQDKIILTFKESFPSGLDVYKKRDILIHSLQEFDRELFREDSPRAILARLTDHPDVFLWGRGFFIHKDNVTYDSDVVRKVATWIENRFDQGHSRFQVDVPFNAFRSELQKGGIPNPYALYTLLRSLHVKRIGQRKFPTIVDLEADVDIQQGIMEELENFFLEAGKAVPYSQLNEEFLVKRGWKTYSLQQNMTVHSELIFPWQDNAYIHLEYMSVDYAKLEELLETLRRKLSTIQGAYSLKGAKREMNVLWEQACPSASVRTMIKLIRSVVPEDLQIERYFIQFTDALAESVSAVAELEEFFLERGEELTKYDLQEEFCDRRGWSENQLYAAIRKARLFRSGKSTFIHPTTINWNERLSQQVYQILETRLEERNKNLHPHMQIEELIYEYVLPELPNDILWTRQLLKSVGQEFGDFLFFDDAYLLVDNEFGIEDLDDIIGFLIARNFKLGIAKKGEVESMLWREGILESGRAIPADQFFAESTIIHLPESDEVGLSKIGFERYGRPI